MDLGDLVGEADRLADARQKTALLEEANERPEVAESRQFTKRHSASSA